VWIDPVTAHVTITLRNGAIGALPRLPGGAGRSPSFDASAPRARSSPTRGVTGCRYDGRGHGGRSAYPSVSTPAHRRGWLRCPRSLARQGDVPRSGALTIERIETSRAALASAPRRRYQAPGRWAWIRPDSPAFHDSRLNGIDADAKGPSSIDRLLVKRRPFRRCIGSPGGKPSARQPGHV
jgi:hypothetical protein